MPLIFADAKRAADASSRGGVIAPRRNPGNVEPCIHVSLGQGAVAAAAVLIAIAALVLPPAY